jgi:hypothetical protein
MLLSGGNMRFQFGDVALAESDGHSIYDGLLGRSESTAAAVAAPAVVCINPNLQFPTLRGQELFPKLTVLAPTATTVVAANGVFKHVRQ